MTSLADLHLHSDCSDGVLSPRGLVAHAARLGVTQLALTDHDTVAGCAEAASACAAAGIRFVSGCELSSSWRGQAIHVIGVGLDTGSAPLRAQFAAVAGHRRERLHEIGIRLQRRGRLPGADIVAAVAAAAAVPTRTHVARELVARGHADSVQHAIERWLGRGAPGHVPVEWPELARSAAAIRAAGGWPVLAHPHRYRLSGGALRQLVEAFVAAGGAALEVSVGGMARGDLDRIATLARRHGLAASCGSDFHDPGIPWNPPGRFAKLPADLEPLSARL
ncbi:MAG: PHP domain-containing protein [Steroidobacteraceae bacterium]